MIKSFVLKLWKWHKDHKADASAHHAPFTDADAVDAVNTDDKYVKKDGTETLTADWDIGDGRKLKSDEVRARDGAGLKLYDDGGAGLFVKDGGNVGINDVAPSYLLDVNGVINTESYYRIKLLTTYGKIASSGHPSRPELQITYPKSGAYFASAGYGAGGHLAFYGETHASLAGSMAMLYGSASYYTGSACYIQRYNPVWVLTTVMHMDSNGNVGINTASPTAKLDVNSDKIRLRTAKTPATAGAAGTQGDVCWDSGYVYVCTSTNTWKRAALTTW